MIRTIAPMKKETDLLLEKVNVRAVQPGDAAALRLLRLEALQNNPEAFGEDYEQALERPYSAWEEQVQKNQGDGDGVIYVADHEGQLVGMAGVARHTASKMRHSATVWGVYVQPGWRGHGIAQTLVMSCCGWARGKGLTMLRLGVITANRAAIHCYESRGFRAYGVEPKTFYIDGRYYDLMRMVLELD